MFTSSGTDGIIKMYDLNRTEHDQLNVDNADDEEDQNDDDPPQLLGSHMGHRATVLDFAFAPRLPSVQKRAGEEFLAPDAIEVQNVLIRQEAIIREILHGDGNDNVANGGNGNNGLNGGNGADGNVAADLPTENPRDYQNGLLASISSDGAIQLWKFDQSVTDIDDGTGGEAGKYRTMASGLIAE